MESVPPRGSGWIRSVIADGFLRDFVPTRYREVALTPSKLVIEPPNHCLTRQTQRIQRDYIRHKHTSLLNLQVHQILRTLGLVEDDGNLRR